MTWGGALPAILEAIVDAIPEGGASPVAPEPAFTINADAYTEESFEEAATDLGISVDELLSLPKQLVVGLSNGWVLTRNSYIETEGVVTAEFGNGHESTYTYFLIIINRNNNSVITEYSY